MGSRRPAGIRRCVFEAALSALLLLAGTARSVQAAELEAHGPSECADTAELSFRVERSLGAPLASAAPLSFEVLMQRGVSAYVARIRVTKDSSGSGKERLLNASDCSKLADAVSVAITLALGQAATEATADPAAGLAATPEPPAEPAAAPAAASERPPPAAADEEGADAGAASRAWVPSLSAWLIGDAGSLPGPSLGAGLGAELAWGRFVLRALGTLLFERHTTLESAGVPAPGADLDLLAGSLLACTSPFGNSQAELSVMACLGLEVGRLAGVGTDVPAPRQGSALWVAPRLDVGAVWAIPASTLRLSASVTAAAPLNRDEFALTGIGTVHQPPSLIGRLSLGVGVGFD
jgi:hypothetical protein